MRSLLIEISPLVKEDIPRAALLYIDFIHYLKEAKDPYYDFGHESSMDELITYLESDFNNPRACVLVAKDDGKIVAIIVGRIKECQPPFKIKQIGYLAEAFVKPDYRSQGVMKRMEKMVIEFFKQHGISFVELEVLSSNAIGKATWNALGYRTFREQMRRQI